MKKILFILAIFAALGLMAFLGGPTQTYTIDASADSSITVVIRTPDAYSITVWNDTLWGTIDGAVLVQASNADADFAITVDSVLADSSFNTISNPYWPYERMILNFQHRQIDSGIIYIEIFSWDFIELHR